MTTVNDEQSDQFTESVTFSSFTGRPSVHDGIRNVRFTYIVYAWNGIGTATMTRNVSQNEKQKVEKNSSTKLMSLEYDTKSGGGPCGCGSDIQ